MQAETTHGWFEWRRLVLFLKVSYGERSGLRFWMNSRGIALDSKLKQRDRLFSIFADSSVLFLSKVLSCLCCAVHSSLHAHLHTHEHACIHLYVLPCLHKIKHTCMHLCIDMYVKNVHIDPFPPSGDRAFSF